MLEKMFALFTASADAVKAAQAILVEAIKGLTCWLPHKESEEETKRKIEDTKQAAQQQIFETEKMKIAAQQLVQQYAIELDKLQLQLRQAVATSTAGQAIIYGFGGITILQLAFNGLVCPFTQLTALQIAPEQWWLLFGVMGLEKLIDLKTRSNATTTQEGTK